MSSTTGPAIEEPGYFSNYESPDVLSVFEEHASMSIIRKALHQYHLKSPAHYEHKVEVYQLAKAPHIDGQDQITIEVSFQGYNAYGKVCISTKCCVILHNRRLEVMGVQDRGMHTVDEFLNSAFPLIDAPLKQDTMQRWWGENGKTFNWAGLPTELKEKVVEYCMHRSFYYGIFHLLNGDNKRYKNQVRRQKRSPFEIMGQLGSWHRILYVSHQIRAIVLRLCMAGTSNLIYSEGLCILAYSYRSFAACIDRLGTYYQMVEADSTPTTPRAAALSQCYRHFPRIYPHLKQYATFCHGIRKISLTMGFMSFLQFFKVEVGGFDRYWKSSRLTHEVFERLPNLNEIVISLPLRPLAGWVDSPCIEGPPLFHHQGPCPRQLHRLIYNRLAEALALYDNVTVKNFVDDGEIEQFESARQAAVGALKLTRVQLEELYANDGGGVELLDDVERTIEVSQVVRKEEVSEQSTSDQEDFFPPLCHCDEPCTLVLMEGRPRQRHFW